MEYSKYAFGMHWSIATRNGFGFDIEATSCRATWGENSDGELICFPFDGIIIMLPFIAIIIGNPLELRED